MSYNNYSDRNNVSKGKKKRVSIDISSYQETQGEMFKDF